MRSRRSNRRGSALLEFTLTGIPLIFIWISIVQMALGMWRYHTLQYAVKQTGSYVSVHGNTCSIGANTCAIKIKDAAEVMRQAGVGLPPGLVNVTFRAVKQNHSTVSGTVVSCTLSDCLNDLTPWPPAGFDLVGDNVEISAKYNFKSAISMFVPGTGSLLFQAYDLPAYTYQRIQF